MQISNSLGNPLALTKINSKSPSEIKQVSGRDQTEKAQFESQADKSGQQQKSVNRFDVDQQALALVAQQSTTEKNNQSFKKQANYDQISDQNYTAISAYQTVDNLAQRETIQQTFGVDFFA